MAIAPAPIVVSPPVEFEEVFQAERKYIAERRGLTADEVDEVKEDLVGLALSGGGIRSATTNLGILQTLSQIGILPGVDYLCTVSGGGYIGGCLSALLSISRASVQNPQPKQDGHDFAPPNELFFTTQWAHFPFRESASPDPERADLERMPGALSGKAQVRHLRTHGNFLIARKGIFARETLRAVGTLLAGVLYHVIIVLLALFVVSAAYMAISAWLAPGVCLKLYEPGFYTGDPRCGASKALHTKLLADPGSALFRAEHNDSSVDTVRSRVVRNATRLWHSVRAVSLKQPVGAAFAWAAAVGAGLGILASLIFSGLITGTRPQVTRKEGESEDDALARRVVRLVAWVAVLCIVATVVAIRSVAGVDGIPPGDPLLWMFLPVAVVLGMWAVALFAALVLALGEPIGGWCIATGLTLASKSDPAQPGRSAGTWGQRLQNVGLRCGQLWTRPARALAAALFALSTYALLLTLVCALFPLAVYALPGAYMSLALGVGAGLSAVANRLLAGMLTKEGVVRRVPLGLIQALLGFFVGAFLLFLLLLFASLLASFGDAVPKLAYVALVAGALFLFLGVLINANKVALHYFYRDRLIETYLRTEVVDTIRRNGGSRNVMRVRHDTTEMLLTDLHGRAERGSTAPYHLISAAINIADQKDLTRKDRKSGYFLFSKLFCGSGHTGYLPTRDYAGGGTKLARAMTISGAAFASAMGYHTFFAQSFATTMFNIRLGYWMDNPADKPLLGSRRTREWAVFWPWQLLKEMLSWTNARTRLVNLSDGGHTGDNVGIYPLFQRGCKIIIACDAEADGALSFGSFTEALRQAYVDLNVDVDIDLSMIRPDPKTGLSKSHCAVGRIRYPDDPKRRCWLIYLKNSRTGDEPEPVRNYATDHPAFPHETTLDQFFTDDQFESYRVLGRHIAEQTFAPWPLIWTMPGDQRWLTLQRHHSSFGAADHPDFQRTAAQFVAIEREFVDHVAYYQECYFAGPGNSGPLPSTAALRRLVMAQATLMEDVYLTLNLRHHANAPDNRGWMNVFRLWARSATFRREMKAIETNFSESFVVFYRNFIENKQPLETERIPHPWDGIEPGIFLDAGRRELGDVAPWRL